MSTKNDKPIVEFKTRTQEEKQLMLMANYGGSIPVLDIPVWDEPLKIKNSYFQGRKKKGRQAKW